MASNNPNRPASPRKKPQQRRAQNTVERLLAATADMIEEHGLEALTTNHIAERAGVNIASLYQYFPNKEAIIAALLEAYFQQISKTLNDVLFTHSDMPIGDSTRLWSLAALNYFRERHGLLELMMRYQQKPDELPGGKLFEVRLTEAMRRYLAPRRDTLAPPNLDLAVEIAYNACAYVLAKHLLNPMSYHSDESVVEEVVRLMVGYFSTSIEKK